jgi:hypothetical protein
MGTPFYSKQWVLSPSRSVRFLSYLANNLVVFPALLAVTWLMMPPLGFAFYSLPVTAWNVLTRFGEGPYWANRIGWSISAWPWWLIGLWVGIATLAFLRGYLESRRINTNIYFRSNPAPGEPLRCLTISAHLLDEALLALSAETIVYALLVPKIWDLIGMRRRSFHDLLSSSSTGQAPIGAEEAENIAAYKKYSVLLLRAILGLLYMVTVHWWWRYVVRLLVAPLAVGLVMNVVMSTAYGLPPRELRRARIHVSSSLDLPGAFDVEEWSIGKEVLDESASSAPAPQSAEEISTRYKHLVDDTELKLKVKESVACKALFSWERVQSFMPEMYDRYLRSFSAEAKGSALDRDKFQREVARMWFTLQERTKEVIGAVELNHSLYYANPRVIQRIADFLADR